MVRSSSPLNQDPAPVALRRLFDDHKATLRGVSARTREIDETGKGINYTYISGLISGREKPSPRALELLAGAFDLDPEFFIEYRMGKLRGELDPRVVGFDAAVRRFIALTGEGSKAQ
jgi:transcriptional regulator with XRE-family HTH domain